MMFHDEDAEVYLNGVPALQTSGFITDYDDFEISKEASAALQPGHNTIAVHRHQTSGGQGIDSGNIRSPTHIQKKGGTLNCRALRWPIIQMTSAWRIWHIGNIG